MADKHQVASDVAGQMTAALFKKTGAQTLAELSDKVMFAVNPRFGGKVFRPGVPAMFLRYAMRNIDGKDQPCVILRYLNGMNGETIDHAHPTKGFFKTIDFLPRCDCTATYITKDQLKKGLR